MEPSIRVTPTVTIEIEAGGKRDTPSRGGSFTMPVLEAIQLADRLDTSTSGELKLRIGGTEFTVVFDRPGERQRFVAALRVAAMRYR